MSSPESRVERAVELIENHEHTDGAHHKQWVLNQVLLILTDGAGCLEDEGSHPVTFINNFYLVVSAVGLLVLVTGLLRPARFPKWGVVTKADLASVLIMAGFSLTPGFHRETRVLVIMTALVYAVLFARQKRRQR